MDGSRGHRGERRVDPRAFSAIRPHLADRRWLSYLDDDDDDAIRSAYGPNYQRLAEVKRRYDPENVFQSNHNIEPASAA
jgi:hypothetical protein